METIGYSKLSRRMVSIDGGSGAKPCVVPRETAVRIRRSFELFEDMVLSPNLVRRARHKVGGRQRGASVWCFVWMRRARTLLWMRWASFVNTVVEIVTMQFQRNCFGHILSHTSVHSVVHRSRSPFTVHRSPFTLAFTVAGFTVHSCRVPGMIQLSAAPFAAVLPCTSARLQLLPLCSAAESCVLL